jgi:hypothetical protein
MQHLDPSVKKLAILKIAQNFQPWKFYNCDPNLVVFRTKTFSLKSCTTPPSLIFKNPNVLHEI